MVAPGDTRTRGGPQLCCHPVDMVFQRGPRVGDARLRLPLVLVPAGRKEPHVSCHSPAKATEVLQPPGHCHQGHYYFILNPQGWKQ